MEGRKTNRKKKTTQQFRALEKKNQFGTGFWRCFSVKPQLQVDTLNGNNDTLLHIPQLEPPTPPQLKGSPTSNHKTSGGSSLKSVFCPHRKLECGTTRICKKESCLTKEVSPATWINGCAGGNEVTSVPKSGGDNKTRKQVAGRAKVRGLLRVNSLETGKVELDAC